MELVPSRSKSFLLPEESVPVGGQSANDWGHLKTPGRVGSSIEKTFPLCVCESWCLWLAGS